MPRPRRPPPDEAPTSTLETPSGGHLPSAGGAPASRRSSSFKATRSRDRVTTSRSWAGASSPLGPRPMTTAPRGGASSTGSRRRISPSRCGYWCISSNRSSRPSDRRLSWASAPLRGRPWKCPTSSRYVACSRLPWRTLTWSGLRAGGRRHGGSGRHLLDQRGVSTGNRVACGCVTHRLTRHWHPPPFAECPDA